MEKEEMVKLVKDLGREETIMLLETIIDQLEEEEILEDALRGLSEDSRRALIYSL